jgi:hypothetical protein
MNLELCNKHSKQPREIASPVAELDSSASMKPMKQHLRRLSAEDRFTDT